MLCRPLRLPTMYDGDQKLKPRSSEKKNRMSFSPKKPKVEIHHDTMGSKPFLTLLWNEKHKIIFKNFI